MNTSAIVSNSIRVDMIQYTDEQIEFFYESYAKYGSARKC